MRRNVLTLTAVALSMLTSLPALAEEEAPPVEVRAGASQESGFAMQLRLGTQVLAFTGSYSLGSMSGGFLAGYKTGRVTVGLGLDFQRMATSGSGLYATSSSSTGVLLVPSISVAGLRAADGRVEMFAQLDLGVGAAIADSSNLVRFNYKAGPGLRYWVSPNFGVSAFAHVSGEHTWWTSSGSSNDLLSIGATMGMLAVF